MRPATLLRALTVLTAIVAPSRAEAQGLALRYGVATFGDVEPLRDAATIAACGYDYIEPGLAKTLALTEADRQQQLRQMSAAKISVETMNWFLPGADIKLTGPAVDQGRVTDFLERSLALADQLGARVIVFGSPGARSFPEGFPRDQAWDQLKAFLRTAGGIIEARRYGMVIGIEPLRKPESNIVNTVAEAARLAREVNHPKVRIIVDFYHLTFENEDPDAVLAAKDLIVHLQIADPPTRGFPTRDGGDARYRQFFDNLRRIGYKGRLSIEANSSNVAGDCGPALKFLKAMTATR